jgi:hypothetical protein
VLDRPPDFLVELSRWKFIATISAAIANGGLLGSNKNPTIQKQLSTGGKVLVSADINPDKQAAVQALPLVTITLL